MTIVTVTGSSRRESSNTALLAALSGMLTGHKIHHYDSLCSLPLYIADNDMSPWPAEVTSWRQTIASAQAVIISTPEYLHGMPAILKNALEWLTTSGELYDKKVLPITYTPTTPRGDRAMQSLIYTLQALNATILPSLSLYQSSLQVKNNELIGTPEEIQVVADALLLLTSS